MSSIVFDFVHKHFRSTGLFRLGTAATTHALRGLSLEVGRGEVLGLLGPNGSGKSTTLKLISSMLLPDKGRVVVNGADTRTQGQAARRMVGFALASERSFFPRLTARENLDFFAAMEDIPRRECRARAESTLGEVGLDDAAQKQAMKLSSGMYQRLGIARALLKKPAVLLLDEPTRSLDPVASSSLWMQVRKLSSTGITVVLATHNFEEAVALCDRVAILREGELLALRRLSDCGNDELREFYLEITGDDHPLAWQERVPA